MKQFNEVQVSRARERATPDIIQALIARNSDVIHNPVLVPETGCATWNHYFFCPDHSVRLRWDRHSPSQHVCPVDGAVFSGEPYDGAWWRWLNGLNAKACYELGILWLLTADRFYLNRVRDILLAYARYYPEYKEHGGIPYNGPGKANAQTLCEANCHTDFARGFDIVREALSSQEEEVIANRLLRTGAEFLIQHRCNQIHNHEVKTGAAIGIIGAVLDDERYLDFAVNGRYGLEYQLQHALLPDGLWFEGSFHYHFYALQGFFAFEKLVAGGKYSLLDKPFYRRMLDLPSEMLMPDMTLPMINDCVKGQEKLEHTDIYEFAWWYYGEEKYGQWLKRLYAVQRRESIDALFYGRALPTGELTPPEKSLHGAQSGLTVIRPQAGRAICVKHLPFGGEHDHYNSLGLSVFQQGRAIFPDLGTTGYGAPLHYGYYKNSFSHNTVCINGKNQPPATPRVIAWDENADRTNLVVEVDWLQPPALPDSKIRIEWDDEAYKGVIFRRNITVTDDLLIDVITVSNPYAQRVESIYLIAGEAQPAVESATRRRTLHPWIEVRDSIDLKKTVRRRFQLSESASDNVILHCLSGGVSKLLIGTGPNNPSTSDLEYLIMQSNEQQILHIVVTDFAGRDDLQVAIDSDRLTIDDTHRTIHALILEKR